jgi:hypothetical protein
LPPSRSNWAYYACIVFGVFAAYLPLLHGYYLHTDDYFWSSWGGLSSRSILINLSILGRPLTGLLYCCLKAVHTLEGMNMLRALSALNVATLGLLFHRWQCRHQVDPRIACCISLILVTLPPFQTYVAYLSTAPFGLSATISLLALMVATEKVIGGTGWKSRTGFGALCILLLMASASLYQPAVLFYVVGLAVPIVLSNGRTFLRDQVKFLLAHGLILSLGLALYYVPWRAAVACYGAPPLGKYDARLLVPDLAARGSWFLKGPLYEALNLWALKPSLAIPVILGIVLCLAICMEFFFRGGGKPSVLPLVNLSFKWITVFAMFPASFAVVLVSFAPSLEYRTYCCLSAMIVVTCFLGGWAAVTRLSGEVWKKGARAAFGCCAVAAVFLANRMVDRYFAFPDSVEIRYIKSAIRHHQQAGHASIQSINIIMVPDAVATRQRHEIGEPSARHGPNIPPMVAVALRELGIKQPVRVSISQRASDTSWTAYGGELQVGVGLQSWQVSPSPETLVIDMSHLDFK